MKFTKDNAVEALRAKLTLDGKKTLRMSERTLNEQTETLMTLLANDDTELEDFVGKILPTLNSVNSNVEHDVAEYVKSHPVQTPPPPVQKPEPPQGERDALITQMQEQLAALQKERESEKAAAVLAQKRSDIKKYLKDNNVDDGEWAEEALGITSISAEDTVEDKGKQLLNLYNKTKASGGNSSIKTPQPGVSQSDDAFKDVIAFRKNRITP